MTLLGGGMSSRLFQEIREKRGLVYSIYAYNNSYRDNGIIGIYAGTGEKEIIELLPIVCQELKRLPTTLTEPEINRAKAQLKSGLLMALESTSSRCRQMAHQILIYGHPLTTQEILAKIDDVSAARLSQLAERFFSQKPTLTALGPIQQLESYETLCARLR
jgi:predicted Zn-dependent peptidase